MHRKVCLLGALALVAVMFSGCASYMHPQGFWEVSKTKVDLESNNFKVRVLGAQGSAQTAYLFGIGLNGGAATGIPLRKQDTQARAVAKLHETWDGKGSAFLHNINQEWTNYGVPGIIIFHQNTITADIYEFDDEYVDYATR